MIRFYVCIYFFFYFFFWNVQGIIWPVCSLESKKMTILWRVFLCWVFTTHSTQWGHVERSQLTTFSGQAKSSKRLTSVVLILSPETDNCPSWINRRERMTMENISWSISWKNVANLAGVEPATSGSPVRHTSYWATKAGPFLKNPKYISSNIRKDHYGIQTQKV